MKTELEQANEWIVKKSYKDYLYLVDKYPQTNITNGEQLVKIWKKETQEYNETFNPEAHSSLIIDFDKVETIEETGNKIFEEDSLLYEELIDGAYSYSIGVDFLKRFAIKLAESDAARNYWFKVFQKEQKTIKQLFEELDPFERAELIQGYCDECGLNTKCYCKNDE